MSVRRFAEAAYVPGSRACDRCLTLYRVRGDRRLVPQGIARGHVDDLVDEDEEPYRVPTNYFGQ